MENKTNSKVGANHTLNNMSWDFSYVKNGRLDVKDSTESAVDPTGIAVLSVASIPSAGTKDGPTMNFKEEIRSPWSSIAITV